MLGVLKRRWKPKRASNGNRLSVDSPVDGGVLEKPRLPSVRQVHPICEEKAHHMIQAYDKHCASIEPPAYPLQPNICVEGGRIEFIKLSPDGSTGNHYNHIDTVDSAPLPPITPPPPPAPLAPLAPIRPPSKITVTRSQQTSDDDEKYDVAKESLEARIAELEEALEAAKRTELRDKQTLAKLQKQLQRRESAQRDVDRERRLRAESEARVREAAAEAQRCRTRLKLLTQEFSRMEETVRAMLVYKSRTEQLKQEKQALAVAYESRSQQYQSTINRLNQEVVCLRQQLEAATSGGPTEGRVAALEADNAVLSRDAEATRRQYERCLDDVANQVVRALLAQKNLREEITSLTRRIKDLESQNRALTTLLVHQLRGENSDLDVSAKSQLALEDSPEKENSLSLPNNEVELHSPAATSSPTTLNIKHCNSFNSEQLNTSPDRNLTRNEIVNRNSEKHLSADADILDTRLSFEDKKRHQVLTKLWTELKGTEVTPQRLIEALSNVDSALWVSPQRPVSLNLQLPIFQSVKCRRTRPILAQSSSKSEEETGNESPESGNRDEGYSTMSSDVQGEIVRASGEPIRGLEDLKEATDETDIPDTRIIVMEDQCDPDILYIPLNFAFGINPRNSFPPSKGILPFQHIMRSFSDSHLCLKITTAPSPCYSLNSPISSSPSILLLDISERVINPLRRTKATSFLPNVEFPEDESQSRVSWCSGQEENIDCSNWETEYVQQWLRIDETRTAMQQQQRDLLELEYDHAELEDWSLNLSSEDIRDAAWRKSNEILTPGQISLSTLPSIQENNALELEEDSNEDLWNNSSYMMDKTGGELVALLMDAPANNQLEKRWPYAIVNGNITSPGDSWSSAETNSEDCFHEQETYSKRSSAALSGCSDETNESHAIGTDFTRDFYRLVKFESTKSLASISSKSAAGCLSDCDREQALQNVLTFIAEQQMYCHSREEHDSRPSSALKEEQTKDFNIEAPPQNIEEIDNDIIISDGITTKISDGITTKICDGITAKISDGIITKISDCITTKISESFTSKISDGYGNKIHDGYGIKISDGFTTNISENITRISDNMTTRISDNITTNKSSDKLKNENYVNFNKLLALNNEQNKIESDCITEVYNNSNNSESTLTDCTTYQMSVDSDISNDICDCHSDNKLVVSDKNELSDNNKIETKINETIIIDSFNSNQEQLSSPSSNMTESQTSSVSTPDTIVSRIPRRRTSTPIKSVSTTTSSLSPKTSPLHSKKLPVPTPKHKSKIPAAKDTRIKKPLSKSTKTHSTPEKIIAKSVITSERLPQCSSGLIGCSIIDGPPHRAVSFHERATSKDVIDELNRMIRKGEETESQEDNLDKSKSLDEACRPTGWIHVEKDIDLNDPKARANLLDVMLASSDSSPTSSCGGSISSESTDDPPDYGHLHRIHRFNRQKKESNSAPCTPITETAV